MQKPNFGKMKTNTLCIFLFLSNLLLAGNGLVVTQKYFDNNVKQNVTTTWYITNSQSKMKMTFADDKVSTTNWFLPDFTNHNLLAYTEGNVPAGAKKSYYAIPLQSIQPDKDKDYTRIRTEKTGEQKTLGGKKCEKLIARTNKSVTEMWVTTDFAPDYFLSFPFFRNSAELNALYDGNIKGFPMESVTKDLSGQVIYSYTFVSATDVNFTPADFEVPAEYESATQKK